MTTTMTDLQTGKTFVFNDALPGRDAYEEALALGFEGTRAEWIASLRGLDFDPASPTWENDRSYPPRAAVIHANSFWFARVTNQTVEPGTDDDVWMKLVHGEDAATLGDAVAAVQTLLSQVQAVANAPVDEDVPGGGFSASHHRIKAQEASAASEDYLALTIAASQALTPISVLHDLAYPVPAGWWDTQHRLSGVTSLLGSTSSFAIISNWQPWSLFAGRIGAIWDISEAGTGVTWGDSVATIADLSPNEQGAVQANAAQRGSLGRAPVGATPSATLDGGSGPAFIRLDLSDDRYPTTFADGGTFDILVAGRGGSWIERDVVIAPAGNLQIGPTAIAGRFPGILSALGGNPGVWADIVGVTAVDRTISAGELARLVAYYRSRGAKGLLVEGPEMLSNPGSPFLDAAGWVGTNAAVSVVDGNLRVTGTGGTFARASLNVSGLTVGAAYILRGILSAATAGAQPQFRTPAVSPIQQVLFTGPGTQQAILVPTSASGQFPIYTTTNAEGAGLHTDWAGFSLRRLIPEEEL